MAGIFDNIFNLNAPNITNRLVRGVNVRSFEFNSNNNFDVTEDTLVPIIDEVRSKIVSAGLLPLLYKIQVTIIDEDLDKNISSRIRNSINDAIVDINEKLDDHMDEYEDSPFQVNKIIITHYPPLLNEDVGLGRSARSMINVENKYLLVSCKSLTNCVYNSLATCKNYSKKENLLKMGGNRYRVKAGNTLKDNMKRGKGIELREGFADYSDIQKCSDYLKYTIELYNNIFQLKETFHPNCIKNNGILKIQERGRHAVSMILKSDIIKHFPNFEFPEKDDEEVIDLNGNVEEPHIIESNSYNEKYNNKIASMDIEATCNGTIDRKFVPYAISFAWRNNSGDLNEEQFWGLDCITQMFDYLGEDSTFKNYTVYLHNGGKFDMPLIIENCLLDHKYFRINTSKCIELNGRWISFGIVSHDGKTKITFLDSYCLLPSSLEKLCKEFNVEHKKLKETVNFDEINIDNWDTFPQIKRYLTHDVYGLLEVIETFGKSVMDNLNIDITKCLTGASLSKKNFFKNYYKHNRHPIYYLPKHIDTYIREHYYGGRVECFKIGYIGLSYYLDFTSLYPSEGRLLLPYGEPEFVEFDELPNNFFGFVRCLVKTKRTDIKPLHCIKKNHKLIFPVFEEWTELVLFSEEIRYGLELDMYYYQFIDGYKFKKGRIMKNFFEDAFKKKAEAKSVGNKGLAQVYKIVANSGYGFWGLRTRDRDGVEIMEKTDPKFNYYYNNERLVNFRDINDNTICRVIKDLDTDKFNVGIAAAITSYSRMRLHKLINIVEKNGGIVYYCDTDSVIININIKDYPEIMKEFMWDGTGEELGSLKNECDEKIEPLFSKDELEEILSEENGLYHFDEGMITGCKQYGLKKDVRGKHIEIVKIKGRKIDYDDKLKYSDIVKMNENGEDGITQVQEQWRSGKNNMISEDTPFHINVTTITKKFRTLYNKGTKLENGDIEPLRI